MQMTMGKTRVLREYQDLLQKGGWRCPDRGQIAPDAANHTGDAAMDQPFPMPPFLSAPFAGLRGYWNSLRRGDATIPYADDFSPAALGKLAERIALVAVFHNPQRFRFDIVAPSIGKQYRGELENRFADEIGAHAPLDYFVAQCSATAESAAATFYWYSRPGAPEYNRLMLPFWSNGHVGAIVAAFEFGEGA